MGDVGNRGDAIGGLLQNAMNTGGGQGKFILGGDKETEE
jgi:hypothetical protein